MNTYFLDVLEKINKILQLSRSMSLWYLLLFGMILLVDKFLRIFNYSLLNKIIVKYHCIHGYKFYARADDYWRFIDHFEPKTTAFVEKIIRNDDVVVDIGAHIGLHTVHFSKRARLVVALEPEPHNFLLLKKNIKINGVKNVIALPIAISNSNGYLDLYISASSGTHTLDLEHGVRLNVKFIGKIRVKAISLDTLIKNLKIDKVDIVKIDVEGHENRVLQGMREILERRLPRVIVVETDRNLTIINELEKYKYYLLMELNSWEGGRANYVFASKAQSWTG